MSGKHSLIDAGVKRLRLLSQHGEALMQGYAGLTLTDDDFGPRGVEQLLAARVLWRSEADASLRISHRLREFIAEMLRDEQRRQINTDMAELLDNLRSLVSRYVEAQNKSDYVELEHVRSLLTDTVDDFNSRFVDATDTLWQRLNSDFGFVQGLTEKIRENQRAQQQAKRLLDGLEMIDFNEWIDMAGSHGFLRRLLVSQWQQQMSEHHSSLRLVQARLVELITRFRQQQASAQMVRSVAKYLRTKVDHQWQPYSKRSQVPLLLNVAKPLAVASHPEITRHEHQTLVAELMAGLPRQLQEMPMLTAAAATQVETQRVELIHNQVKQAAEAFYLQVVEQAGKPQSALAYWQQQQHPWEADIWLFQVLSEYQGLPRQERSFFTLTSEEQNASTTNELRLVRDYHLALSV